MQNNILAAIEDTEAKYLAAGKALQAYPRSAMGLVSDDVRVSPGYQAFRRGAKQYFAELRRLNTLKVKFEKKAKAR